MDERRVLSVFLDVACEFAAAESRLTAVRCEPASSPSVGSSGSVAMNGPPFPVPGCCRENTWAFSEIKGLGNGGGEAAKPAEKAAASALDMPAGALADVDSKVHGSESPASTSLVADLLERERHFQKRELVVLFRGGWLDNRRSAQ